ncbi:hypothetical protein TNCV_4749121 [Trichonephila clavipes]|nr:hypothetical protein TNCV_4749121 [Trichonephila clavipes]
MKSLVFETPVNSAEELVARISAAAGEIRNTPEMLSNVRRSMKRRCEACITCGGRQAWVRIPEKTWMLVKGIVPSRHGGILNSCPATNPFVRMVEGEERWKTPYRPQDILPQNWGGTEQNRTVTTYASFL